MSTVTAIDGGIGNKLVLHSHKENPDAKDSLLICIKTEFNYYKNSRFYSLFRLHIFDQQNSNFEKTLVTVLNKFLSVTIPLDILETTFKDNL